MTPSWKARPCGSALRAITLRWCRPSVRCCWPAASVSRRSCAWPNAWPAPVPTSRCITAPARPSAPPLSSASARPVLPTGCIFTTTTAMPPRSSTCRRCSKRPAPMPTRTCAGRARLHRFRHQGAAARQWTSDRVHFEYFAGQKVDTPADGSFEVKLASSGQVRQCAAHQERRRRPARGRSEHRGVVRAGRLRHLPDPRARRRARPSRQLPHRRGKAANNQFLPCCSRARGKLLVLDL